MTPDYSLVHNIKNNIDADKSIEELMHRHQGIIIGVLNKYCNQTGIQIEEVSQDQKYILWKAAVLFKEEAGCKFSSWLHNYTRFYSLDLLAKYQKHNVAEEGDYQSLIDKEYSWNDDHINNSIGIEESILGGIKNKRLKEIIRLRFFEAREHTYGEIGQKFNITVERVRQIIESFLKKLKKHRNKII